MELYLKITYLNDFIFCPLSINYHQLYGDLAERLYYNDAQLEGKAAHETIDNQHYSTHKNILQGIDVYSDEIKNVYMKTFTEEDSVIIFNLSASCKKTCYVMQKTKKKMFLS